MKTYLLCLLCATAITQAATVYSTGPTVINGIAENSSASFTMGTNSVTIQITNNIVDPASIAQNIVGINFSLSNGSNYLTGIAANSVTGFAGASTVIASNGLFTTPAVSLSTIQTNWLGSYIGGNQLQLSLLPAMSPNFSIVGGAGANNIYDGIPSSMASMPFLAISPSFTVGIQGVTTTTQVSNIKFLYANSAPNDPAGIYAVPEPATFGMLALGLAVVGLAGWCRTSVRRP